MPNPCSQAIWQYLFTRCQHMNLFGMGAFECSTPSGVASFSSYVVDQHHFQDVVCRTIETNVSCAHNIF